ncbi:MAG: hypothetical protein B7Y99_09815 [Caulobacterales bacterium 32-69-10]|nr:MAG: hypothetical protein B7Y99_09815 [Caulobacterales bacterium 32-69-10]
MTLEPPLYDEVVAFWREAGPKKWFARSDAFDAEIRGGFEAVHLAAARGELADWAGTADGALALLLLTDQFPRNMYRGSAHAFATDPMARAIAEAAVRRDFHQAVEPLMRPFFFLPYEHSEAIAHQDFAVALFEAHARESGDEDSLKWAHIHRDIIKRFGRFPHRNAVLGRVTTPGEQAFLDSGGFKG